MRRVATGGWGWIPAGFSVLKQVEWPVMIENAANADAPIAAAKPRRRWFQYRLRSLMLLMLLVGIGMTWLVAIKHRAERQKEAVEIVVKNGGMVLYDYQEYTLPSGATNFSDNAQPPGPAWLRTLLGDDFFTNVVGTRIVTQAGLDQLAKLPQIQRLELGGAAVTDSILDQLNELSRLDRLGLENTSVTDNGMKKLAGLTQLKWLILNGNTGITDDGLKRIAGLRQLEYLDLSLSNVTDAGLKHLRLMTHLQELRLGNTRITGAGLRELVELPQLHNLYVNDIQLNDTSAEPLSRLGQLQKLDLDATQITDAGLEPLGKLKSLRGLALYRTHVTDEGIAKLQQALPHCHIEREPFHGRRLESGAARQGGSWNDR